jgi:hypothetical protein
MIIAAPFYAPAHRCGGCCQTTREEYVTTPHA